MKEAIGAQRDGEPHEDPIGRESELRELMKVIAALKEHGGMTLDETVKKILRWVKRDTRAELEMIGYSVVDLAVDEFMERLEKANELEPDLTLLDFTDSRRVIAGFVGEIVAAAWRLRGLELKIAKRQESLERIKIKRSNLEIFDGIKLENQEDKLKREQAGLRRWMKKLKLDDEPEEARQKLEEGNKKDRQPAAQAAGRVDSRE
jgi:hypothetical protein